MCGMCHSSERALIQTPPTVEGPTLSSDERWLPRNGFARPFAGFSVPCNPGKGPLRIVAERGLPRAAA